MKKIIISSLLVFIFVVFLGFSQVAQADIKYIALKIDGLHCPFCAYELAKNIKKIKGVSNYDVDMKQSKVFIKIKEQVKLSSVYNAVNKSGYYLKKVFVRIEGKIVQSKEGLMLLMTKDKQKFMLYESGALLKKFTKDKIPKLLGDKMRQKLIGYEEWGKDVLVEGSTHYHKGLPFGLLINKIKATE